MSPVVCLHSYLLASFCAIMCVHARIAILDGVLPPMLYIAIAATLSTKRDKGKGMQNDRTCARGGTPPSLTSSSRTAYACAYGA